MFMKKLSIIIATFNASVTLRRCLESIVSQLTEECELLVIDGGSTDGTQAIIKEYKEYIAYTVSEKDFGVYDAWNKGIKVAKGEWIVFIGADDVLLPHAIDKYAAFLIEEGDDYDIICGKLHFVDKNGKVLRDVGEPWNWNKMTHRRLKFAHPGMLHNRRCFERIGFFDTKYKICADSDFLQRLGPNTKAAFINEFLVNMQEGGISDSFACIREGHAIRRKNKIVNNWSNNWDFLIITIKFFAKKMLEFISLKFK